MLFLTVTFAVWAQDGQARIIDVQGKVEIKEAGSPDWKNAVTGDSLANGTTISTCFKSAVIISLGTSQLIVRPLTMLTLEELVRRENTEETYLYLQSGRIRVDIDQSPDLNIDFSVRSAYGSASVRGTSFEFDGRYLWVENGLVRLENNNRQKRWWRGRRWRKRRQRPGLKTCLALIQRLAVQTMFLTMSFFELCARVFAIPLTILQ